MTISPVRSGTTFARGLAAVKCPSGDRAMHEGVR